MNQDGLAPNNLIGATKQTCFPSAPHEQFVVPSLGQYCSIQ